MIVLTLLTQTGKSQEATNDFYDDAETFSLKGSTMIQVSRGDRKSGRN